MAFTIPDAGEGDSNIQSILFQEDLDVLLSGICGNDCVLNGLAVTGGADMTPAVAKGSVLSNGVMFAIAAADVTITAADGTNPRIDFIVVTSAGALAVRAGTPAAAPKPPAKTANDVVIASVYVPAGDTAIGTSQITDRRVNRDRQVTLKKQVAAVTFNTTAVIQTYLTATIPNGLFLLGRILRVRMGGTYLLNSGTPTITLTISYGGTTMFADVSIAAAADADRGAWWLDFDIKAVTNSSQVMNGMITYANTPAGKIAASTGIGDMLGSVAVAGRPVTTPIKGTSALDSDAANRDLLVRWTMSVSNVANEITCDGATVELL